MTSKIVEGVFAINKPQGITSAQVVRDLQTHFNPSELFKPWLAEQKALVQRESHNQRQRRKQKKQQVKIGHGGTLDPLATGVLITGIGKGTKVLQDFLQCTKTYETIILFGASTDTQDRTGRILKRGPYKHITRATVEKAMEQYKGTIMQLPPLYSALKMNGKPLYEYAREGKPIPRDIERREVTVNELELLEWYESGSHPHRLPTEEAGKAEKEVAQKVWNQEHESEAIAEPTPEAALEVEAEVGAKAEPSAKAELEVTADLGAKVESEEKPASRDSESLAAQKRKLEDNQDGLVTDRPASKKHMSRSKFEATMSGGLKAEDSILARTQFDGTSERPDSGPPAAKIRMTVTSGFYVRSFCQDLGEAVGSQALMAELIRSRQGQFELGKNVLEYEELGKGEEIWGPKVKTMLETWSADYKPFAGSTAESNVPKSTTVPLIPKHDEHEETAT